MTATGVQLRFNAQLTATDPQSHPTLIVGQLRHLTALPFVSADDAADAPTPATTASTSSTTPATKLAARVTAETWHRAIASLHPAPTDFCPLYLNVATVAALPATGTRHNTGSRAHALTRLVRTHASFGCTESVVVVCERADLYASACAVARAFPLFSRKTAASSSAAVAGAAKPSVEPTKPAANAGGAPIVNVEFILMPAAADAQPLSDAEVQTLQHAADAVRLAARLVDAPPNEMNVPAFVFECCTVADRLPGVRCTVLASAELRERGFGGLFGVGQGAGADGSALVVLTHRVEAATETVAWVGKGIVYDTGGLSIKGKTAMPGMKRDCGGAAAVLGAFEAAVRAGFAQTLHAVFCLAENAVGPAATRPDDIHRLYSGRTVEINNTDAEGRLVLADGVVYAQRDLRATIIVDVATLTGAQGVATGKYHGAVLCNRDEWERAAVVAGRASGDLLAPLVYCPELHFGEFASAVADMKNSVADRSNALASCAGLFIGAHLGFAWGGVWLHVDMAYPVHSGERATGYGVALLNTLFGKYSKCPLLQSIAPDVEW